MTPPILVVAFGNSVHTLRWLQTVRDACGPLVLIPSTSQPCLAAVSRLPRVTSAADVRRLAPDGVGVWQVPHASWDESPDDVPAPVGFGDRRLIVRGAAIADAVRTLRPALLHAMEIQSAGYACLRAAALMPGEFPRWLVSNWGSDLFLYEKLAEHRPVLLELVRRADSFVSECQRDIAILRGLGCSARRLHVLPASGGADFDTLPVPAAPPSSRREIVLKGYHGWSGRAIHAMSALHQAAPVLGRFTIRVTLASGSAAEAAHQFARASGLRLLVDPWVEEHGQAQERLSRARLMIGIGISDGIGTTLLESMALGVFPVVAQTSCAIEWVRPDRDGFVVDPHDIGALARAVSRAATDDALVDAAAVRNRAEVERRWDRQINRHRAVTIYQSVMGSDHER